jgi:hypothetical protein
MDRKEISIGLSAFVATVLLIVGTWMIINVKGYTERATGTIVSVGCATRYGPAPIGPTSEMVFVGAKPKCQTHYTFTVKGDEFSGSSETTKYQKGDMATVSYDPVDPYLNILGDPVVPQTGPILLGIGILLFVGAAGLAMFK